MTASVSEAPRIAMADEALPAMGPPINLFKLFARNRPMAEAMTGWGSYELSKRLSLSTRQRELVIDRAPLRYVGAMARNVRLRGWDGTPPSKVTAVSAGSCGSIPIPMPAT
jgi:hypothetical protein